MKSTTSPRNLRLYALISCCLGLFAASALADTTITISGDSNNPGTATLTVSGELSTAIPDQLANIATGVGLWFPQDGVGDTNLFYDVALDSIDFINAEGDPAIDIALSEPIYALYSGNSTVPSIATFDVLRLEDDGGGSGDDWGLIANAALNISADPRIYSFLSSTQTITFGNQSGFAALTHGEYTREFFLFGDTWKLVIVDQVVLANQRAERARLSKKINSLKRALRAAKRKKKIALVKRITRQIAQLTRQLRAV